jgi:hypothetical protein
VKMFLARVHMAGPVGPPPGAPGPPRVLGGGLRFSHQTSNAVAPHTCTVTATADHESPPTRQTR